MVGAGWGAWSYCGTGPQSYDFRKLPACPSQRDPRQRVTPGGVGVWISDTVCSCWSLSGGGSVWSGLYSAGVVTVSGMWDPAVDPAADPVLCSPYEEPDRFWGLDGTGRVLAGVPWREGRRPPVVVGTAPADQKAGVQQSVLVLGDRAENELVRDVREQVGSWRAGGYGGCYGYDSGVVASLGGSGGSFAAVVLRAAGGESSTPAADRPQGRRFPAAKGCGSRTKPGSRATVSPPSVDGGQARLGRSIISWREEVTDFPAEEETDSWNPYHYYPWSGGREDPTWGPRVLWGV